MTDALKGAILDLSYRLLVINDFSIAIFLAIFHKTAMWLW